MKRESDFQSKLKDEIRQRFPGAIVLKNDPGLNVGFPDLTILYKDKWAVLECKKDEKAKRAYSQIRRVESLNEMSYASFIYPENKEEVLNEMEQAFGI